MSLHDTIVIVVKVLTIITTIMLRLSLFPDFNRWRKNRNTGNMSVMPCVLVCTNCYVLAFFAYAIDDMLPLFATSVLGVIVGGTLAFFFYRWTEHKRATAKIIMGSFVVCVLVTVYGMLALTGITGQTRDEMGTTMGWISIPTAVVMYASPMATIVNVIRTKTASSMPFTMGVVVVCNSFSWAFYGILVGNGFLLGPNVAGFILGVIQLSLTFIYPRRGAPKDFPVVTCQDARVPSIIVLPPSQDDESDKKRRLDSRRSSGFIAIRSPAQE